MYDGPTRDPPKEPHSGGRTGRVGPMESPNCGPGGFEGASGTSGKESRSLFSMCGEWLFLFWRSEKYVRVWAPKSGKYTDVIRSVGCDREGRGSRLMTPGWWGHVTPQRRLLRRRTVWVRARVMRSHTRGGLFICIVTCLLR